DRATGRHRHALAALREDDHDARWAADHGQWPRRSRISRDAHRRAPGHDGATHRGRAGRGATGAIRALADGHLQRTPLAQRATLGSGRRSSICAAYGALTARITTLPATCKNGQHYPWTLTCFPSLAKTVNTKFVTRPFGRAVGDWPSNHAQV